MRVWSAIAACLVLIGSSADWKGTGLAGVLVSYALQSRAPSDFEFVWEHAHCYQLYRLDTRDGTVTRQRLSAEVDGQIRDSPVRASMNLSAEEREKVFAEMLRIGFFDFPAEISYPPDAQIVTVAPQSGFRLGARRNGTWTRVHWTSRYAVQPRSTRRDQLEALGNMIQGFIDSRGGFRQLSGRVAHCE